MRILVLILCLLHAAIVWSAELRVSDTGQMTVTHKGVEITVPAPDGYVPADHRRLQLDNLPQLQDRQILAAFAPRITAHNEYTVAPEPGHSQPSYYLVYRPRLAFSPGSDPATILDRLEKQYYAQAFAEVSEEQRYALQRLDEKTVSVTWVDLSRYALQRDEEAEGSSINCINSIAYRKGDAILMFDTLEACGLDAVAVKTHGEAWLKRIKSANEPLSYGRKLLAEKGVEAEPASGEQAGAANAQEAKSEESADTGKHDFLWLLAAILVVFLGWAGLQRWLKARGPA